MTLSAKTGQGVRITKSKVIIFLLILGFLYSYLSTPGKVAVNSGGEVIGLMNIARASLQGKRFWVSQLNEVSSELEWWLGAPERRAKLEQTLYEISAKNNERMEAFYEKHPNLKPSYAKQQEDALRERADQIEQQEIEYRLEEYRQKRISELQKILVRVRENAN